MNNLARYPHVLRIHETFHERFPYFRDTVSRQFDLFGDVWLRDFETDLAVIFGDDWPRLTEAVLGYGRFSLESMKLQKLFDKTREYEHKSYQDATIEVYQNREYMFNLYLPGILLSHFLWFHHYKQQLFYREQFLPRVRVHGGTHFYDVGVGTGFYSKEMLRATGRMRGEGFDLSPFSMEFTSAVVSAFGLEDRYDLHRRNIVTEPIQQAADFVISIEVLEHLEAPQEFLDALCRMLKPGGLGLISAALTAPNADHIYLYNEPREVADQLNRAGFEVVSYIHDPAYVPRKPSDSVPRNVAFIVTRP